jgi:hypothetical protein
LHDADIVNISYDYTLYYADNQQFLDQIPLRILQVRFNPMILVGENPGDNDPMFVNYDVTQFTLESIWREKTNLYT